MALPTVEDIQTMDIPSRGLPYVDVPAKTGITTQTMDYVSRGLPFVTNDDFDGGAPPATAVKDMIMMGIIAFPR